MNESQSKVVDFFFDSYEKKLCICIDRGVGKKSIAPALVII